MRFPTSKRGEGGHAHSRRKFALGAAVCLLALVACLAACAPHGTPANGHECGRRQWASRTRGRRCLSQSFSTAADFTERSTGLYPEIQRNAEFQNSGNRGCAACHDDLFTLGQEQR